MNEQLMSYFSGDSMSADVWRDKYCIKDSNNAQQETTPIDMHMRMAKEFGRMEYKHMEEEFKNVQTVTKFDEDSSMIDFNKVTALSDFGKELFNRRIDQTKEDVTQEIFELFERFDKIVPQGSIMSNLGNKHVFGSLSNCFGIASPYDSYGGIFKTDQEIAQLEKRRGGVGTRVDSLRPEGTSVTNAAKSSTGIVSFCERFSNTTREVAQGGRRGALMLLCHVNHPDIFKFVSMKDDKTKVTGANVSVMFTEEFMKAVEADADFICRFPIDTDYPPIIELDTELPYYIIVNAIDYCLNVNPKCNQVMKIHARELFDLVAGMAHKNGEPGVAFIDRIVDYSPDGVYEDYAPTVCNPCILEGSLVNTPNGYRKVETLQIGESISTVLGEEPIENIEVNEGTPILEIKFSDGGIQYVTPSHIYYGKHAEVDRAGRTKKMSEIKAEDLVEGDYVRVFPTIIANSNLVDYKDYFKKGVLLGDGCYTEATINHGSVSISCNSDEEEYISNLEELFNVTRARDYSKRSKAVKIFTTNEAIAEMEVYTNASNKNINILQFDNLGKVIGVLDGLLATDGNVNLHSNHPQLRWTTCSSELATTIRRLLLLVGCHAFISQDESRGGSIDGREIVRRSPKFTISISGASVYNYYKVSKIGDYHPQKGAKLISAVKDFNLSGNLLMATVVSITPHGVGTSYDLYCSKSDTWITEGYVQRGCGEQWFHDYDTCRLMAMNFYRMISDAFNLGAEIDTELVYSVAYMQQRLSDNLVDLEIEYIDRIISKISSDPEPMEVKSLELEMWFRIKAIAQAGRRTGNGFTGLGDMFAALGVGYGSEEALHFTEEIMRMKMMAELDCMIDMAILRGAFNGCNPELEFGVDMSKPANSFFKMLTEDFPLQARRMYLHGRRNVSWSTVAPTGTVSLMTQTTSGLEPLFKAYYIRRKKINPSERGVRIDFTDQNGDTWQEYSVLHPQFKNWIIEGLKNDLPSILSVDDVINIDDLDKDTILGLFRNSPWFGSEANDITPIARIKLQAIIQKYTSNAISSTINISSDTSVDVVKDIYLMAWKKGLKGVTVYRDGSRSGVLISEPKVTIDRFGYHHSPKRPRTLDAHYYHATSKGNSYAVIVGILDDIPYEIFAFEKPLIKEDILGQVIKLGKGEYTFQSLHYNISNLQLSSELSDERLLTRWVSMSLRHGTNPKYIAEQVEKSDVTVTSFAKVLIRVLKRYIPNEELKGEKCIQCGEVSMIYEEGCKRCSSCGHSKC